MRFVIPFGGGFRFQSNFNFLKRKFLYIFHNHALHVLVKFVLLVSTTSEEKETSIRLDNNDRD